MVCNCCVCNKEIRKEFIYFCHGCYRSYLYMLKITNQDFINYINISFNCNVSFNQYYCFRKIYNVLKLEYDLINLDRILENILYIKMLTTHKQIINLTDIKHHSKRFQNKMILRNQTTF